jgi:hypothetical protein
MVEIMSDNVHKEHMDLIYFGYPHDPKAQIFQWQFIDEVTAEHPEWRLENGYDNIKGYRQCIYCSDDDYLEMCAWLIGKGWFSSSFNLQLLSRMKETVEQFETIVALAKEKYPDAFIKDEEE